VNNAILCLSIGWLVVILKLIIRTRTYFGILCILSHEKYNYYRSRYENEIYGQGIFA
jgi:hypothetical protein